MKGSLRLSSEERRQAIVEAVRGVFADKGFHGTTTRELADSQLFGHRRGSFTGAMNDQLGLVRTAAGGTLFLDEVGDMSPKVQAKVLRVLEEQRFEPVGSGTSITVDVRLIAATNKALSSLVSQGRFREDLYFRLKVVEIDVPPLRERPGDIELLPFDRSVCRDATER